MGGDFLTRQYAYYLQEHQHPHNRATHFVGIPVIVVTMALAVVFMSWKIFVAGQVVGWFFQLLGHRIEGNRPALLKRPISFLMGPLMVTVEILGFLGLQPAFAKRAEDQAASTSS